MAKRHMGTGSDDGGQENAIGDGLLGRKVIRDERFSLDDREIDLDLVEPDGST
jgi:hypothetical protein